eukprot:202718-Chlamydomonas_euryale.AAC.1
MHHTHAGVSEQLWVCGTSCVIARASHAVHHTPGITDGAAGRRPHPPAPRIHISMAAHSSTPSHHAINCAMRDPVTGVARASCQQTLTQEGKQAVCAATSAPAATLAHAQRQHAAQARHAHAWTRRLAGGVAHSRPRTRLLAPPCPLETPPLCARVPAAPQAAAAAARLRLERLPAAPRHHGQPAGRPAADVSTSPLLPPRAEAAASRLRRCRHLQSAAVEAAPASAADLMLRLVLAAAAAGCERAAAVVRVAAAAAANYALLHRHRSAPLLAAAPPCRQHAAAEQAAAAAAAEPAATKVASCRPSPRFGRPLARPAGAARAALCPSLALRPCLDSCGFFAFLPSPWPREARSGSRPCEEG